MCAITHQHIIVCAATTIKTTQKLKNQTKDKGGVKSYFDIEKIKTNKVMLLKWILVHSTESNLIKQWAL